MVDRMYYMNKYLMASVILSITSAVPSYAFDMDAALAIYQAEQDQKVQQDVELEQTPQKHTREYYQQKWLEQQGQVQAPQPVMHDMQGQQEYAQAAPEADDLFLAAVNGNNAQIGKLLAQGLDINVSNTERETALHMAAARGHYSTVIYLVNNGAYANARTVKNWIPLHHAVRFRHPNIVNFLMKRGSSAHEKTSDGLNAIDMAGNVNDYRMLSILGAR
jgi:hypothetical protein